MNMRKRAAKRLKVSTGDGPDGDAAYRRKVASAGRRLAARPKTDEEKRLEEALFGVDHTPVLGGDDADNGLSAELDWLSRARNQKLEQHGNDNDENEAIEGLTNDDLFMLDEPGPSTSIGISPSDTDNDDGEPVTNDDEDISESEESASTTAKQPPGSRAPLWQDPADASTSVSLKSANRLRKLRKTADEDTLDGVGYENRLRQHFHKIHPSPSWATNARSKQALVVKGRRTGDADDAADVDEDNISVETQRILHNSSAGIRKLSGRSVPLPAGELQIERLRDVNQVETTKSPITALQFHPSAPVLFSTSEDRRLRLYQVDGSHNPLVQSVHTPDLPISAAAFHPSGSSILLTGDRPFFYSYDLQAGRIIRSPRSLWSGGLGGSDGQSNGKKGGSMEMFKFSPDGRFVAVAGRRGHVHLLDWGSDGKGMMAGGNGGQVVGTVKINSGISGLAWNRSGTELVTVGDDAQVYTWDMGTRKCLQRWTDNGGFAPTCVQMDGAERYFAIGSRSGIINLYDANKTFSTSLGSTQRLPLKSIMNLTTNVTTLSFNKPSEILAIASRSKTDSLKLVHLPSATIFSKWPTAATPLGHVSAVGFSSSSEFIAIGGHKGRVLLYNLKHYSQ